MDHKEDVISLNKHCIFKKRGTRGFLMYRGQSHVVSETGAEILEYLSQGMNSVALIVDALSSEYNSPDIKDDVIEFLEELKEKGIIEVEGSDRI